LQILDHHPKKKDGSGKDRQYFCGLICVKKMEINKCEPLAKKMFSSRMAGCVGQGEVGGG